MPFVGQSFHKYNSSSIHHHLFDFIELNAVRLKCTKYADISESLTSLDQREY